MPNSTTLLPPGRCLLFLADTCEYGYAKTALGL